VRLVEIGHRFGDRLALDGISLDLAPGEIHALMGPSGAGKTTLLRIIAGLLMPDDGDAEIGGVDARNSQVRSRGLVGLVPSDDGAFSSRSSGLENLVSSARRCGLGRREAKARALALLEQVGLGDAADVHVGAYSHGMVARFSVACAVLPRPRVLLLDEATRDLDAREAFEIRTLVRTAATEGAAVIWTTQLLDDIRGFVDGVSVLVGGRVSFRGSVEELVGRLEARRYVLQLGRRALAPASLDAALRVALVGRAAYTATGGERPGHVVVELADGATLSDALLALARTGVAVLDCREARRGIEEAFFAPAAEVSR
jgi:ABC-type multidrug transport system ATPase subunit